MIRQILQNILIGKLGLFGAQGLLRNAFLSQFHILMRLKIQNVNLRRLLMPVRALLLPFFFLVFELHLLLLFTNFIFLLFQLFLYLILITHDARKAFSEYGGVL